MRTIILLWILVLTSGILSAQEIKPEIYFSANQSDYISLVRGMPLILRVRLNYTLGITREELMMEIPDSLQEDPETFSILDSLYTPYILTVPGTPWYKSVYIHIERKQRGKFRFEKHVLSPYPSDTHLLYPDVDQRVMFGIDPELTLTWKSGTIRIRVGFLLPSGKDTLWSRFLTVVVLKEQLKGMKVATNDQLLVLGHYYANRGDCKRAEATAKIVAKTDTLSFDFMTLMGAVAECKRDPLNALLWYQRALMNVPRPSKGHAEEPFILYNKIQEQKEKLIGK